MISKEELEKLAELSRLKLSDAEKESLGKDISNILDYVGQISTFEGKAEKKAPLNHNVMREDVPHTKESPLQGMEENLKKAFPRREGDFAVVRKILQKDE